ncbi:ABC transporter permease [Pseudoclavibacter chungangensis]|uniref:ABC transporter permease n=1 Tax=Pseudoclavibacter chungangensis TaxID=587635 RepID=A0A7J5BS59_9MICO|nr:ABC transporter permease [Pseudoclavibacter chungangensis]KAB1655645.1 ABC transporter permease [Pseudoclavibacter chungangensis]NYJ67953.1 peptide/nickel transport system permease protein [Pseudoclavibacter chungangensis]
MTTTAEPSLEAKPDAAPTQRSGGGLWRYLLVRALLIIPTVFILVSLVFVLMRLTGDPITAALGDRLPPDQLAQRITEAGYDRPILVQYVEYLGNLLRGDFGTTISTRQPVLDVLFQYGPATLELAIYALVVAFAVGIPLGRIAAYRRDLWQDAALRISAILFYATPVFFAGLMLKLVFGVWLQWLPIAGRLTTSSELQLKRLDTGTGIFLIDAIQTGRGDVVVDVLLHAVLPAVALGLLTAGVFLRLVRTNMIGTLQQDYVTAARSRGVRERRLVNTHAWRPALVPIITVIGLQIALLLGGAVLTETTFEWRGLGFMLVEFIKARDFVAVQGIVALLAVIVAVTNFVVDVVAALVDPRVRF